MGAPAILVPAVVTAVGAYFGILDEYNPSSMVWMCVVAAIISLSLTWGTFSLMATLINSKNDDDQIFGWSLHEDPELSYNMEGLFILMLLDGISFFFNNTYVYLFAIAAVSNACVRYAAYLRFSPHRVGLQRILREGIGKPKDKDDTSGPT